MVSNAIKNLVSSVMNDSLYRNLKHGDRVRLAEDGRLVQIVSGSYWGAHGLSNFWHWRPVLENGDLGKEECGYGGFVAAK